MDATTREMIKETIKTLQEFNKLKGMTQVEREAEIVRTVKQLSTKEERKQ